MRAVRIFRMGLARAVATAAVSLGMAHPARAADPTPSECVAESNASAQLEAAHALRRARARLLVCVSASCPALVREECARRMDQLTSAIPTVVFVARDAGGGELSAVKVTIDDEVVADHLEGTAVALDPGSHRLTVEAPGRPPLTREIILHEGEKDRREVFVVDAAPAPASHPPSSDVPPSSDALAPGMPPAPAPGTGRGVRSLGLVLGGAGVAGVVVGGVFGALTITSWGSANGECPTHAGCSSQASQDRSNALSFATVSTVAFVAGGALLVGGLTVYLTAPKDAAPAARVDLAPGGLTLRATF
jgi:hypothetical protein